MEKEAELEDTDAEDSKLTRKHRGKSWSWHANFTFFKIVPAPRWELIGGKILHEMRAHHLATECTLPAQMRELEGSFKGQKLCLEKRLAWKEMGPTVGS